MYIAAESQPTFWKVSCVVFFVSDLHGRISRYTRLFQALRQEKPDALFIGGDLLAVGMAAMRDDAVVSDSFFSEYLEPELRTIRSELAPAAPDIFLILGNDDPRVEENQVREAEKRGSWNYVHDRRVRWRGYDVFGYSYVPPTPFQLKDWERYDVSRYVDPGCVSPESGLRTVPVPGNQVRYKTIQKDLEELTAGKDLGRAIMLFHSPPYQTHLDRAALDGKMVEHVPLDVHVGSIAIQRFIETRQPWLTLHGHIHESARLTGHWKQRMGETMMLSAAHDGPELSLVSFDPEQPSDAERYLL